MGEGTGVQVVISSHDGWGGEKLTRVVSHMSLHTLGKVRNMEADNIYVYSEHSRVG